MTPPQPVLIGVDVGSTNTSGGLVTPDGKVLLAIENKTHRDGPGTAFDILLELVDIRGKSGVASLFSDGFRVCPRRGSYCLISHCRTPATADFDLTACRPGSAGW